MKTNPKNKAGKKPGQKITKTIPVVSNTQEKVQLYWYLLLAAITLICFLPMFQNGFTNWDDQHYVTENPMLIGPDWHAIFTQPVASNYHPLTMLTLAFNYQISQLDPSSYMTLNLILHIANTLLAFYFILLISGRNVWVSFLTAVIFAIHPLHVESVAWVSERKDVLYTFFFILSLIQYWKYLESGKKSSLWLCFIFFILSLLSKPAAIILPLVLVALDYWKSGAINIRPFTRKIPFLLIALVFAIITLFIQKESGAVSDLNKFPIWTRPLFASYGLMIYFFRFFIPYPLSVFHPFPAASNLGLPVLLSPIFLLAFIGALFYFRKNRLIIFSFVFFIINLLLVLQIISVGAAIVSERYTYVPYIGLAFLFSMLIHKYLIKNGSSLKWIISLVVIASLGTITYGRVQVWKNGGTIWDNAVAIYPDASTIRLNRANYKITLAINPAYSNETEALYQSALDDVNIAIHNSTGFAKAYENRAFIYYNTGKYDEAFEDANTLLKLDTLNHVGYAIRGAIYIDKNEPDKALSDLSKSISINNQYQFALENRAFLLYSHYKKYREDIDEYSRIIELYPQGNYYLYRSYCYYNVGDLQNAKKDAYTALQKGVDVPVEYRNTIGL